MVKYLASLTQPPCGGDWSDVLAVELGCGTRPLGCLLAAQHGLHGVLLTDGNPAAVEYFVEGTIASARSSEQQWATAILGFRRLLWGDATDIEAVCHHVGHGINLVLACDVLYWPDSYTHFWETAAQLMSGHGCVLIAGRRRGGAEMDEVRMSAAHCCGWERIQATLDDEEKFYIECFRYTA